MKQAIDQKRPELANRKGVVFHQDNARPHTSLVTRQKLRELGWKVLSHPPCSQDIAPSDYHLFLSMANALGGIKLVSKEACENCLSEFFANKEGVSSTRGYFIDYRTKGRIFELNPITVTLFIKH